MRKTWLVALVIVAGLGCLDPAGASLGSSGITIEGSGARSVDYTFAQSVRIHGGGPVAVPVDLRGGTYAVLTIRKPDKSLVASIVTMRGMDCFRADGACVLAYRPPHPHYFDLPAGRLSYTLVTDGEASFTLPFARQRASVALSTHRRVAAAGGLVSFDQTPVAGNAEQPFDYRAGQAVLIATKAQFDKPNLLAKVGHCVSRAGDNCVALAGSGTVSSGFDSFSFYHYTGTSGLSPGPYVARFSDVSAGVRTAADGLVIAFD